ncbi:hypothetical protein [Pseudonocardia humida]|uniref:Homeodomain-like domain-containing protein n=1 Tax=Pseudonocardia humida TaxID=2800819 RepID=A0ABT0ZU26_9PSEU|nr:hypothetical protein [Pseudonocardia humida]MCO1654219.1 hypothetical protein [Pseudonocardia humida]
MAERYLGVVGIGEALGVTRHAVHKWRSRHPAGSDHPFPEPDVEIDGAPGWRPDRVEEVVQWRNGLPGRGAGGGRPSASQQEYMTEAFARGLNEHEALSALDSFAEEFPEMTRAEICAWLLGKWRD